jgi:hypothetical protein
MPSLSLRNALTPRGIVHIDGGLRTLQPTQPLPYRNLRSLIQSAVWPDECVFKKTYLDNAERRINADGVSRALVHAFGDMLRRNYNGDYRGNILLCGDVQVGTVEAHPAAAPEDDTGAVNQAKPYFRPLIG